MVYDGSASGLNDAMWVPRFPLPTIQTHLRAVEEGTYMADLDIGKMFLNFVLHEELRELCGLDIRLYADDANLSKLWGGWERAVKGLKFSPYQSVQGVTVAEKFIRGDPDNTSNVLHWDEVRLNLPGSDQYNLSKPWVSRVQLKDDVFIFVDNVRATGASKSEGWLAARKAACGLNHLGIQDASQKRRDSARAPGA
jgi:hypothetical protein